MDFPNWQLHRGFWKKGVRENTMEAFRQARQMNCKMVELDVQLSQDKVLHVFHDFSLQRFFHVDQKLSRTKSEDLSGLGISTLAEVLESEEVPEFLNIEVKSRSPIAFSAASKLVQTLKSKNKNKKVLISSFNPMVLFWLKKLDPSLPRALIVGEENVLMSRRFAMYVRMSSPHYLNCHYRLIDEETSREQVLFFEKPIMVWTVNEQSKAKFYLARGAKSIISDLPPRAK